LTSSNPASSQQEVDALDDKAVEAAYFDWKRWASPKQLPPPGDWTTWLLMGGRGSGKTRAGAEWVRQLARERVTPIALVGETMAEALEIMVRGESGILAVHPDDERPIVVGKNKLFWPNGVEATVLTASDPDRFRGPQFAAAWCDEVGCGAVDKGANQPNIFGDAKSAEGGRPYFSSGLPDGLIQRQFLRAHHRHWSDTDNNPAGMVDPNRLYCWTWDARPYPTFPALTDVWADGPNHRTGHWLTGRLGAMASDELVAAIATDHGCVVTAAAAAPLISGMVGDGPGTARDGLGPVLEMTGQHLCVRDGGLVAMPSGAGAVFEVSKEGLVGEPSPTVSQRRGGLAERPARLALSHIDRERDYLTATATALRPGEGPLLAESAAVVLDPHAARQVAERMLDSRGTSLDSISFALPPNAMALEPGDRVLLDGEGTRPFEVREIRDGLVRRITARVEPRAEAMAVGNDRPAVHSLAPEPAVEPVLVVAHLSSSPDDPGRSRLALGAFAQPWPGTVRVADAATGAVRLDLTRPAVMGTLSQFLATGPRMVWDWVNAVEVSLGSGHLADVSAAAALAGSNRLAVETDSGEWEVIGFARAELVAARRYRLTGLLRGLDGSDHAIGPASAGCRVMVLDGRVGMLAVEPGRVGASHAFRAYAGSGDLSGQALTITPQPAPALPLAPVHLRAARHADGNIRLDWVRRSRGDGADWGLAEPVLEHAPESWRLRIFQGPVLKRTINSASAEVLYSSAQQLADFGGAPPAFTFTVSQVSAALGTGHVATGAYHG
jgi:hypothetical protein